jgi:predicted metal-dependent phosphoesterase TrpH
MKSGYSKADLHIHTIFSDGLMSPEALVEHVATKTDLRVIAVTDHDTIGGALVAKAYADYFRRDFNNLEVIVGSEITSAECDILALFIEKDIPPGLSAAETIDRIQEQNGIAIAAHPYAFVLPTVGIDGMKGAGSRIQSLPFDAVETRNATPTEFFSNWLTVYHNRKGQQLVETGGSDTHYLPTVGSTYTWFPGQTAADLRTALEHRTVSAGGHVYSPLLIFNVLYDMLKKRLPMRNLPLARRENWPLSSR